jgi:hypothetical protein
MYDRPLQDGNTLHLVTFASANAVAMAARRDAFDSSDLPLIEAEPQGEISHMETYADIHMETYRA